MAAAALIGLLLCLWPHVVQAQLRVCNQTSYVIDASAGVQQGAQITTRGWSHIRPGDCANAIPDPLKAPAYFLYARSLALPLSPQRNWGGQFRFCVRDGAFSLQMPVGAADCKADGSYLAPFAAVSTGKAQSWTTTLTDTPALAAPNDAREAGLRRYLTGLGYLAANDRDPKQYQDALSHLRQRAKLATNASPDDLFAALEGQVKPAPAASGYSICNDGKIEIWTAIAFWSGKDFVSRGWWDVAAGSCAMALGDALGRDAIYLYASKHGNNRLVSGPDNFCISDATFEIHGRDRCEAHGYTSSGFLATNVKGASAFVARIGDNGLVTDQPATPK